jgi:hypothetical protein
LIYMSNMRNLWLYLDTNLKDSLYKEKKYLYPEILDCRIQLRTLGNSPKQNHS